MKNKTLFLLTKTYPFGKGEQYIGHELEYVSKTFEKVFIYPNDYYDKSISHDKLLPGNVEVLNFNSLIPLKSRNGISDYVFLFKNSVLEFFQTDDKQNFIKNFKWNLINFCLSSELAKSFSKYLKENNFNSSNSVFYSYWFHKSAIFLSILKSKKSIHSFVSRAHSIDLYHEYWGVINEEVKVPPFKFFKLKHVDKIITISNHGLNFIKSKYPKYASKVSTFYLGISDPANHLSKKESNRFLIVTCSHLDWTKQVDKLADALVKITTPFKWVHFGGGSQVELDKIQGLNAQGSLNSAVEMKGYVTNKEVHDFYKNNKVNLFVNLSLVEGVPVSIMEALAYEIPILATAVYGTPEAVIDGKNGFLLDVNFSQEELVTQLNYCIQHKDQLEQMGKASKEIYLEKFSAEKNYCQFANYLSSL